MQLLWYECSKMDNHSRIWVLFTTLILVTALVLMIVDGQLNVLMRIFAAMPGLPRGREPDISQTRWWTAVFFFEQYTLHLL